jgi:hypothetical protein
MRFAIGSEDLGNGPPLTALDFLVQIEEPPTQFFRQAPAHRSFSGAHEANQVNSGISHSKILAQEMGTYWRLQIAGWKLQIWLPRFINEATSNLRFPMRYSITLMKSGLPVS